MNNKSSLARESAVKSKDVSKAICPACGLQHPGSFSNCVSCGTVLEAVTAIKKPAFESILHDGKANDETINRLEKAFLNDGLGSHLATPMAEAMRESISDRPNFRTNSKPDEKIFLSPPPAATLPAASTISKPADEKPAIAQTAVEKATDPQSITKLTDEQTSDAKRAEAQIEVAKLTDAQTPVAKPAATAIGQPAIGQPTIGQPTIAQPAAAQTAIGQSAIGQSAIGHSAIEQSSIAQPATAQSSGTDAVDNKVSEIEKRANIRVLSAARMEQEAAEKEQLAAQRIQEAERKQQEALIIEQQARQRELKAAQMQELAAQKIQELETFMQQAHRAEREVELREQKAIKRIQLEATKPQPTRTPEFEVQENQSTWRQPSVATQAPEEGMRRAEIAFIEMEAKRRAAEQARAEEQARAQEEILAAARARADEQARIAALVRAEEQARIAEARAKAEEEARVAAQAAAEAQARIAAAQAQIQEQARAAAQARADEQARIAAAQARADEQARAAAAQARADEQARAAAAQARADEQARAAAAQARADEQTRIAAVTAKVAENGRTAALRARSEEQARIAAAQAKQELEEDLWSDDHDYDTTEHLPIWHKLKKLSIPQFPHSGKVFFLVIVMISAGATFFFLTRFSDDQDLVEQGLTQLTKGQYAFAVQSLTKAAAKKPHDARVFLALARAYIGVDQVDEAWKSISEAQHLGSGVASDPALAMELASYYERHQNSEKAVELLRPLAKADVPGTRANLADLDAAWGDELLRDGKLEDALRCWEEVSELKTGSRATEAANRLTTIYQKLATNLASDNNTSNDGDALKYLNKLNSISENAKSLEMAADLQQKSGQLDDAIASLRKAATLDSTNHRIADRLSKLLKRRGQEMVDQGNADGNKYLDEASGMAKDSSANADQPAKSKELADQPSKAKDAADQPAKSKEAADTANSKATQKQTDAPVTRSTAKSSDTASGGYRIMTPPEQWAGSKRIEGIRPTEHQASSDKPLEMRLIDEDPSLQEPH